MQDPLTAEAERNIWELREWYENDTEVKERMECLETSLKGVQQQLEGTAHVIEEKGQFLENEVREEAKGIKDRFGEELKTTTENIQRLVREEAQDIKDQLVGELKATTQNFQCQAQDIKAKLSEVHQSIEAAAG